MTIRLGVFATTLLAATLALTACSPPPPTSGSASASGDSSASQGTSGDGSWKGKTVTVWLSQKPDTMSPFAPSGSTGNAHILDVLYDRLAVVSGEGELVPRVAESWEVSEDATTYTINLADQKFSDGSDLTADDVVFSLNLYSNPDVAAPIGAQFEPIKGYEEFTAGSAEAMSGIVATDEDTVTISLTEPNSGFLYTLLGGNYYILSKAALEGEDPASLGASPIWSTPGSVPGLGPFVMKENLPDQRVVFERNENFREPVQFETLVQSLVTQDVATQQLASGEMDLTLVAPTDVATVEGVDGVTTVSIPATGVDRYSVMQAKEEFKNPLIRQGLLTAIDRAGIIASVYNGQAEPVNTTFLAPYIDAGELATYDYDPERAKQLLTEGGWDFNRELTIYQASGNPQREAINAVVAQNLQAVGVKAKIVPFDQAQTTDVLTKKEYDLLLYGGGNYLVDSSLNFPILSCTKGFPEGGNLPNYCNQEVDKKFAEAQATADQSAREEAFNQAAMLDNSDVSHLWIARPLRTYAYSSKLTGGVAPGEAMPSVLLSVSDWTVS